MIVTGPEALTQKLDIPTKKTELNFEDLTEVHVYSWLLSVEQKAAFKGLTDTLLASVQTGSKRKATKKASPEKPAKRPARPRMISQRPCLSFAEAMFG